MAAGRLAGNAGCGRARFAPPPQVRPLVRQRQARRGKRLLPFGPAESGHHAPLAASFAKAAVDGTNAEPTSRCIGPTVGPASGIGPYSSTAGFLRFGNAFGMAANAALARMR